jgi:hypothetical protein
MKRFNKTFDDNTRGGNNPGNSTDGLTMTDIPSRYNGQYAFFKSSYLSNYNSALYGCQSIIVSDQTGTFTFVRISDGQVSLPLWTVDTSSHTSAKYNGTVIIKGSFYILNQETSEWCNPIDFVEVAGLKHNRLTGKNTMDFAQYEEFLKEKTVVSERGYQLGVSISNGIGIICWDR